MQAYCWGVARHAPKVFISYAQRDELLARRLAAALEKVGLAAWWAGKTGPGQNSLKAAARALDEADALVWLCSPEWASSPFARYEIELALTGSRFARRVFPIVVRAGADYPWILREFQLADFSRSRPTPAKLARLAAIIDERLREEGTGANLRAALLHRARA